MTPRLSGAINRVCPTLQGGNSEFARPLQGIALRAFLGAWAILFGYSAFGQDVTSATENEGPSVRQAISPRSRDEGEVSDRQLETVKIKLSQSKVRREKLVETITSLPTELRIEVLTKNLEIKERDASDIQNWLKDMTTNVVSSRIESFKERLRRFRKDYPQAYESLRFKEERALADFLEKATADIESAKNDLVFLETETNKLRDQIQELMYKDGRGSYPNRPRTSTGAKTVALGGPSAEDVQKTRRRLKKLLADISKHVPKAAKASLEPLEKKEVDEQQ